MAEQILKVEIIDDSPYQKYGRQDYGDIPDLGRSIAIYGLNNKPAGRMKGNRCELKEGHRRIRAFRWLKDNWKKEGLPNRYEGYTVMPIDIQPFTDEEMLDGNVIENAHREDLSDIEKVNMMIAYREEKEKITGKPVTSEQLALAFNMKSASTVRGMLYLDNLLPIAKDALHTKAITQGTARDLLTLQKIAPQRVVVDAVAAVQVDKDEYGRDMSPREVIEEIINELPNVRRLWRDGNGGKPRAAYDKWLLDAKKFPNNLLPTLTFEEVKIALDIQDGDKKAIKTLEGWVNIGASAEGLNNTPIKDELMGMNPDYVKRLEHLLDPSACSACPFYAKLDGIHYCGMRVCFDRKEVAWKRNRLPAASKELGIAIYDPKNDGEFIVLQDYWQNDLHKTLFEKKNKDLRLAFMADVDRVKGQLGYDGVPEGSVVLVVGKTLEQIKNPAKVMKNSKDAVAQAIVEKKEEASRRKKAELFDAKIDIMRWEATLYIKELFDNFKHDSIQALWDGAHGWPLDEMDLPDGVEEPARDAKQTEKDEFIRRLIAFNMLPYVSGNTVKKFATELTNALHSWGVKLPAKYMRLAEQMDEEIKASVAAETGKKK